MKTLVSLLLFSLLLISQWGMARSNESVKSPQWLDAKSFGLEIQDFMNAQQEGYMLSKMTFEKYLKVLPNFPKAFQASGGSLDNLLKTLADKLSVYSEWKFLDITKYQDNYHLLFRVVSIEQRFDYMIIEVGAYDNELLVQDWYFYTTELWATEAFERAQALWSEYVPESQQQRRLVTQFFNLNGASGIEIFQKLDEELQAMPIMQSRLYLSLTDDNLIEGIKVLLDVAPKDRFTFSRMDYYYAVEDYASSLKALNQMLDEVSYDPQLQVLKSEMLFYLGKEKEALAVISDMIRRRPNDDEVYYFAFSMLAFYENYDQAILALKVLEQDYGYEFSNEDLLNSEDLAGIVTSSAYKQYRQSGG